MDYRRSYIRDLLGAAPGTRAEAFGWVKTRRDSKNVSFVQLNDGSSMADLQVVVETGSLPETEMAKVTTGASVKFAGTMVEAQGKQEIELKADDLEVFGPASPDRYPLQKKGASFEFLREIAHLRVRGNTFGAVMRVRNQAAWAIHSFFQERGFCYVQTPIITTSDCEGAGEMFAVTMALEPPQPGEPYRLALEDPAEDFFGKPAYLTVSGQLEAEALALGLTNVYTFGPTFRAENSNSVRHLAEFWMVEPEMAFCSLEGDMALAEEFLKAVISRLLDTCAPELEFFNQRVEPKLLKTLEHVAEVAFERMTYTEAVGLLQASSETFEYPVEWGCDLQSEHERWLVERKVGRPVVLYDYPKDIKAFYMRLNDDEKTVAGMDVLAPRIGEIIGGAQREERIERLARIAEEMDLDPAIYGWYLDLRRFGSAPHSGFGLGFERLLMYVTGMKNIRDVIPFHRAPGQADF